MCSVNTVVAVESLRAIIEHGPTDPDTNEFFAPAIAAVGSALGVKFILFLYCFSLRNKDSQIRMLWEDHRNDLFLNGFGELQGATLYLTWYLDSFSGIIMSAGGSRLKWCTSSSGFSRQPCI
jgi:hypothetical protein